jgi:C1A family cysteine protease
LALLFISAALAVSLRDAQAEFIKFQRKYNKVYDSHEFSKRFQIFKDNLERAEHHQKLNPKARFGVTKFMDLSPQEFAQSYKMTQMPPYRPKNNTASPKPINSVYAPDAKNWDWFEQGVCTPVYNQGQCGSCWAFSATETIESYWKISGQKLRRLSMEQIVDCDTSCYGCGGGWPYLAYEYVAEAGGIDSYTSYPYTAEGGNAGTCSYNSANVVAKVASGTSYNTVSGETGLYQQASTTGPVSVCVDASSWSYYQGGVLTSCTNNVDHCVQLTGYANYGSSSAYWIVRNSWGTDWGEDGFIWIEIGQDLCSIGDYATVVDIN